MKNRLYIQLGRAGDILNVLPLLWLDSVVNGQPPVIMVAREFAAIMEGVTYANVVVWPGAFNDILGAYKVAEVVADQMGCDIICTQIYGNAISGPEHCTSFMRQSWDQVPGAPPWGSQPLHFDRRDLTRERGVQRQLVRGGKPYIVTALSGTSSPFFHASNLLRYLRTKLANDFEIVDISGFLAPRFYDLITLLENAHSVVAVDSGVLHLMHAAPRTPVIAFVTRDPSTWHGTPWRPNHVARFYYDEAPECFLGVLNFAANPKLDQPEIRHGWAHFGDIGTDTERRQSFARETWRAENALAGNRWKDCQLKEGQVRTSQSDEDVQDPNPCPFVHDIITRAAHGARPYDVIAYTNSDVCFTPGLTGWVLDKTQRQGAAFTHRWDYHNRLVMPFRSEAEVVTELDWYPGSDAFFFTVAWWRKHRHEMPDMICGREKVDEVLRQLIKRHGGLEIHGAIYHEKHPSFWEADENFEANPGNQHNRRLAHKWFLKTGYGPNDPEWWQIPAPPI